MAFEMREMRTRADCDVITDVMWHAMQEPLRPSFHWLHPVHGYTEQDCAAAKEREAERLWQSSQSTSPATSHWFVVVDRANDEQACGAVQWQVYPENPFPNGPTRLQCTWFPESEARDFVTEYINQLFYPRMSWMNRPFIALSAMGVIPAMRGRGIGTLMMNWGLQQAEERDLECWVEASSMGRDLYEKFDFRPLMSLAANMHKKNASLAWKRLQDQARPTIITLLWRPKPTDLRAGTVPSFWQVMASHARQGDNVSPSV